MRRYYVEQKVKSFAAFLIILILLPYIVSVFVNGTDILAGGEEETYVTVKTKNGHGAEVTGEVGWTEYLAGILAEEMPETYEPEALKAQAVIIRTNLYRELEASADKVLTQEYMTRSEMEKKWSVADFAVYYEKYVRAVEETDDDVLLYNDSYAWLPYFQASNGSTRSSAEVLGTEEYPYVAVRECPLDKEADGEIQLFTFEYCEVQKACRDFLVAAGGKEQAENGYSFADFEICSCDSAGYVMQMRIGDTVCSGDQFRDALGLPSSCFSLSEQDGKLQITTTGKGHGLGLSQWTADEMAKEGKNYAEILQFFYEGTVLNTEIQETSLV